MNIAKHPTAHDAKLDPLLAMARAEAEERAHDRISPDSIIDPIGAVNMYVEAFVAGARFAAEHFGRPA